MSPWGCSPRPIARGIRPGVSVAGGVGEEAILELLTTQRAPAPLGYPDRIQTAGWLRDYVIGAQLSWHGFERTVEETLRRAAAPQA